MTAPTGSTTDDTPVNGENPVFAGKAGTELIAEKKEGDKGEAKTTLPNSSDNKLGERIASCALHHYEHVLPPAKGKPKEGSEWTVFAAIIAEETNSESQDLLNKNVNGSNSGSRLWVVSCATGTKCSTYVPPKEASTDTNASSCNKPPQVDIESTVLRDCHAEALARRAFMRVLWREIYNFKTSRSVSDCKNRLLNVDNTHASGDGDAQLQFCLRSNLKIHMYVSDSLCGDASIYELDTSFSCPPAKEDEARNSSKDETASTSELNFTGAKVIVSDKTGVDPSACGGKHQLLSAITSSSNATTNDEPNGTTNEIGGSSNKVVVARENVQILGKLRTKSGRSNLPLHMRSTCMSCSDKVVRWNLLGLQGGLLSSFIPSPILLSSIVVSQDPRALSKEAQLEALDRATRRRIAAALDHLRRELDKNNFNQQHQQQNAPELSVCIVSPTYSHSKSTTEYNKLKLMAKTSAEDTGGNSNVDFTSKADEQMSNRKRKRNALGPKMFSPCGMSLNWHQDEMLQVEQIVGARGLVQGKKPQKAQDYIRITSRLSRYSLKELAGSVFPVENDNCQESAKVKKSYRDWKNDHCCSQVQQMRSILFSSGPLAGWLTS